ncbi:uncharacterized protein K460DRAFT_204953 [Cucurbitaria berberidis CBS 394.84]|uniref:Uncharacterized protein n=1 Tax=Cucurbitaria berberidis CBS 394.84 TaxID=1168544 RepID=A0A9P4G732_9PLEO|nr:uncharacterized protein K460DRAFT_204953 [Cucurbitaria berberidis CBS 394.84]KAF1840209.1 hypothetical protein K460DRAFT_204953 [Cucurbitaria berberidis CBS 394.84]
MHDHSVHVGTVPPVWSLAVYSWPCATQPSVLPTVNGRNTNHSPFANGTISAMVAIALRVHFFSFCIFSFSTSPIIFKSSIRLLCDVDLPMSTPDCSGETRFNRSTSDPRY